MTTIRLRLHTNLDGGVAFITPDIITQILGNLPGRIEAVRTSTDEMIVAMGQRLAALEEAIARRPLPPAADRQSAIETRLAEDRPRAATPLEQQDAKPCAHQRWAVTFDNKYQCLDCWVTLESQPAGLIQPAHAQPLAAVDSGLTSVTDPAAGESAKTDADEAAAAMVASLLRNGRYTAARMVERQATKIAALRRECEHLTAQVEDMTPRDLTETMIKNRDEAIGRADRLAARVAELEETERAQDHLTERQQHRITELERMLLSNATHADGVFATERAKLDKALAELAALHRPQRGCEHCVALSADLAAATERAEKAEAALLERDRKITERDDWFDKVCRRLCEAAGADVATLWSDGLSIEDMEDAIKAELAAERETNVRHQETIHSATCGLVQRVQERDAARADADALAEVLRGVIAVLDREWPHQKHWRENSPEAKPFRDAIAALAAHDAARKGA